jgi:hypothetical protein
MTRLVWDSFEDKTIRYGVEKGVLYPISSRGVAWNGLVSVDEIPTDGELKINYFDGQKYTQEQSPEGFAATIESYTFPEELLEPVRFGLAYQVIHNTGYELHLVYNAKITMSDDPYSSVNALPDPSLFKWNVATYPEQIIGARATSHVIIDSNSTYRDVLTAVEAILYGDEGDPRLPGMKELLEIFGSLGIFIVVDNGDGTWTANGPDEWIQMLDSTTFQINTPSAYFVDANTYKIDSW